MHRRLVALRDFAAELIVEELIIDYGRVTRRMVDERAAGTDVDDEACDFDVLERFDPRAAVADWRSESAVLIADWIRRLRATQARGTSSALRRRHRRRVSQNVVGAVTSCATPKTRSASQSRPTCSRSTAALPVPSFPLDLPLESLRQLMQAERALPQRVRRRRASDPITPRASATSAIEFGSGTLAAQLFTAHPRWPLGV